MTAVVIARCVECDSTREIKAGEIPAGEMPFCKCGGVMIADSARTV